MTKYIIHIVCVLSIGISGAGVVYADKVGEEHSYQSFSAADGNGDGIVDEAEFGADVAAAFAQVDANYDGKLSAEEVGPELSHEMADHDTNDDGFIDMTEIIQTKSTAFDAADANKDEVDSLFQGIHTEVRIHGVGYPPRQDDSYRVDLSV